MGIQGERVFWGVLSAALLFAVFASLLIIPYPFFGDQALFAVFARMMGNGATLYVDIWDVKQPGIFWFFQLGGGVFGLNEIGIHVFEALYWLLSTTLIAVALRSVFRRRWVAGLLPLLAPGLYFVVARTNDLTQVEALISPLVFGVAWLLMPTDDDSAAIHRPLLAGVFAGVIVCFKLLAVVVPLFVVATAMVLAVRSGLGAKEVGRRLLFPFVAGASIPLAGLLVWVAMNGLFSEVWFTWFEFPRQAIGLAERPISRLGQSVLSYSIAFAPVGLLALLRVVRPSPRARPLTWLLLAAIAGGVVLVVMQLWWAYLLQVLTVPLAVLALQGFDDLLERPRTVVIPAALLLAVLAVPTALDLGTKASEASGLLRGQTLDEYRMLAGRYVEAVEETAGITVEPAAQIYVLGSPVILELLEADQSVPIHGWSPQFWTDAMWREVADDLGSSDTEALYISDVAMGISEERAPWFADELSTSFSLHVQTEEGRWLVPRTG